MLRSIITKTAFRTSLCRAPFVGARRRFAGAVDDTPKAPPEFISLTFVEPDGTKHEVEKAQVGDTFWNLAFKNKDKVDLNLDMSCDHGAVHPDLYGQGPQCEWCHLFFPKELHAAEGMLEPKTEAETDLLYNSFFTNENSRLGCQITVKKEMDGMTIGIPPRQEWYTENFDMSLV